MTKRPSKRLYQQELKKIISALKAYKPEKIILFGSMLDSSRASNDIDLFLVKKTSLSRLGERAREARRFLPDQGLPVDFLIYTPDEIGYEIKRGNVFIAEILNKGKLLYEEKDMDFSRFKESCQTLDSYYIETKYPATPPFDYPKEEVEEALEKAEEILKFVKEKLSKL